MQHLHRLPLKATEKHVFCASFIDIFAFLHGCDIFPLFALTLQSNITTILSVSKIWLALGLHYSVGIFSPIMCGGNKRSYINFENLEILAVSLLKYGLLL